MKEMTLWNIARACHGRLLIPTGKEENVGCPKKGMAVIRNATGQTARRVLLDSREVGPGDVFVATVGERTDGHRFIDQAFARGAVGAVCEKEPAVLPGACIVVEDSFLALRQIAAFYRSLMPIPIVGITGSVGKTSTKEFVAAVLSQKYKTHRTRGNFNNEVGVPLTLLSMPEDTQAAVVEMGINHFGEMHRLSEMVRPDICVLTNIGQCHLEYLGSRDGILKAKSEIFDFMSPTGWVCVNGDDDKLATVGRVHGKEPVRFGLSGQNDVYAGEIENCGLSGSKIRIHIGEQEHFWAKVPLPGLHMVNNALAATAVAIKLGLTTEQIAKGIASVQAVDGRSRILETGEITLIDDCYNANPVSMESAIDLLGLALGRKVAVLGDMFELGEEEKQLHARVGRYVAQKGVDCLLCAGELSYSMWEAAKAAGLKEAYHFSDREKLLAELQGFLKTGDSVLVKASHGMGYEKVVEKLAGQKERGL